MRTFTLLSAEVFVACFAVHLCAASDVVCNAAVCPERANDLVWENDKFGMRAYGPGEYHRWSGFDVFNKNTASNVCIRWTRDATFNRHDATPNFHQNLGEGMDNYTMGASRGVGGIAMFADGEWKTYPDWETSRIIHTGDDYLEFEIVYPAFSAAGKMTCHITLKRGERFFRNDVTFERMPKDFLVGPGIDLEPARDHKGSLVEEPGLVSLFEDPKGENGKDGSTMEAVFVSDPSQVTLMTDHQNCRVLAFRGKKNFTYWAGASWSLAGEITTAAEWHKHVNNFRKAPAGLPPEASPEYVGRKIMEHFLSTEPEDYCPEGYTGERMRPGYVFYAVGSMWVNAMEIARSLGDAALEKRLVDKFLPFYGEKRDFLAPPYHVDTTVFGAVPYEVYLLTGDKRALEMGASYADRQWEELSDEDVARMMKVNEEMAGHLLAREKRYDLLARGYTPQTRFWIDDMYMISFLQTQAFRATEDRKYIDRTAKEMALYLDELQLKDGPNAGLFYHAPDVPFVWARGDGWMAGAMVLVLKHLPPDSPCRERVMDGYRKMMAALLKAQRTDGLWGQLVDDPESWSETSGSAMFTYAFIEGVKNGWLSAETYGPAARRAWIALCGRVDALGNTHETCVGTGKKNDRQYYLDRPRITGDPHGQAAMLWCVNALTGTKLTVSSSLAADDAGIRDFLAPAGRDGAMQPVRKDIPDEGNGRFELVNRKADGFRCIWDYNQHSGDEYVYKYSGGIGVYCEGHIPLAVYSKEADKTFFCYGGTDSRNSTLFHAVSYFDHKTGKLARPTIVFDKHTQDAHDNPVINLDDRGYIYIFASSHGTTRPSAIARSEKPFDISRFKVVWEGNYSYPQPYYFPGKGFLWLQTRYTPKEGVWQWRWPRTSCFMTSDPEVENWSPCKTLQLFNEGHYQRSWPFGTKKVGVVFDQHPEGKGLNWRTDVFYMETSDFGKTWQNAAGETLEIPVSSRDTPALAIPYAEKSRNVYIKGVKFDLEGRPIVLYTVSKGYRSGPKDGPREWKIAKWTGAVWREIDTGIRSDSNYDFAELYVEPDFWRIIGASEVGPQPYNCGGEIAAWISRDAGETWALEKKLTSGSERNQNYPRQPLSVHPGFYAFWADGHGRKPSVSRLYFCDKDLNVYMMPLSFEGDAADPIPYKSK